MFFCAGRLDTNQSVIRSDRHIHTSSLYIIIVYHHHHHSYYGLFEKKIQLHVDPI
jgi:hypothetical protein